MIRITEITSVEQMASYREDWARLLSESETNVVYLTYEWVLSCWQVFGSSQELLILVAEQNSKIVGIAPLSITTCRVFGKYIRTVKFISNIWADYNDIIATKELKGCVLAAMLSHLSSIGNRWNVVKLDEIPSESTTISFSEQLAQRYFKFCRIRDSSVCPRLVIEHHRDEVEKKLLRRKDFKYRHNWLNRQGNLEYRDCNSIEEILSVINTYFDYHISRWEPTETKSLFYAAINREFFRTLVKNMFGTGHLKFSVLGLNNLPLAFCFGFEYNKIVIRYKSTFNNAFRKRSPGLVLLKFMVEEAVAKNMHGIDYVRGVEDYKTGISNGYKENKCIYMYNKNVAFILNETKDKISRSRLFKWLGKKKIYLRLRRLLREYPARYSLFFPVKILQRLLSILFVTSRSYLFSMTKPAEKSVMVKCPIDIRKSTANNIWQVASAYGCAEGSAERQEIEKAFENGDECFLAFEGMNLVHCSWVCRGRPIGIGLNQLYELDLDPNEACIYHCRTSPVYRGMGVYPAVLQHIQKEYFSQDVEKIYICCSVANASSVRGIEKAGFSREKTIRIVKVFGKKIFAK